jgi:hypothetical protein
VAQGAGVERASLGATTGVEQAEAVDSVSFWFGVWNSANVVEALWTLWSPTFSLITLCRGKECASGGASYKPTLVEQLWLRQVVKQVQVSALMKQHSKEGQQPMEPFLVRGKRQWVRFLRQLQCSIGASRRGWLTSELLWCSSSRNHLLGFSWGRFRVTVQAMDGWPVVQPQGWVQ